MKRLRNIGLFFIALAVIIVSSFWIYTSIKAHSIDKITLEENEFMGSMKPMLLDKSEYASFTMDYTLKKPELFLKFLCRYEITIYYKNGKKESIGTNGHGIRVFNKNTGYKSFTFLNSENIISKYWKIPEREQNKQIDVLIK